MDDNSRCTAQRRDGQPCRAPRTATSAFCAHHDPNIDPETKREWARSGALVLRQRAASQELAEATNAAAAPLALLSGGRPDLRTPAGVTALLESVAQALIAKQLAPSSAAVLVKLAEAASKNLDVEIAASLQAVVEERKRQLKAAGAWR